MRFRFTSLSVSIILSFETVLVVDWPAVQGSGSDIRPNFHCAMIDRLPGAHNAHIGLGNKFSIAKDARASSRLESTVSVYRPGHFRLD